MLINIRLAILLRLFITLSYSYAHLFNPIFQTVSAQIIESLSDKSPINTIDLNNLTTNSQDITHSLDQNKHSSQQTTYSDYRTTLVVGEQLLIKGDFDQQISLSKKSMINIKWINSNKILITPLKPGIILFNPTPLTTKYRRWLIKVISQHQAKKSLANSLSIDKPTTSRSANSSAKNLQQDLYSVSAEKILKDLSFLVIEDHTLTRTIDCYHPQKKTLYTTHLSNQSSTYS